MDSRSSLCLALRVVETPPVAIIDVGSNSIKGLVAARTADGNITALKARTIEARISAGISHEEPQLSEEGIVRGVEAIQSLLAGGAPLAPVKTIIVATSAVRDARNGADFCARVHAATGQTVRILTGNEEANLIGRGLTCDPAVRDTRDFYVFDLGGGSLECLAFRERNVEQAVSLPLGCVRLFEMFVKNPAKPFSERARFSTMQLTHESLVRSGFKFSLPAGTLAIGTGGTMAVARAVLGEQEGKSFEQTDPFVKVTQLRRMLSAVGKLPLAERQQVPGLPPARADIFPTALATFIVIASLSGFAGFRHSLYNLRYGLADEALSSG